MRPPADSRLSMPMQPRIVALSVGVFAAAAGLSTLHVGLSRLLAYVVLQAQALVVMSCAPFALALGIALMARPERRRHPLTPGKLALLTQLAVTGSLVLCSRIHIPLLYSIQLPSALPLPLLGGLVLLPFVTSGRLLIGPFTRAPGTVGVLAACGFAGVAVAAATSSLLIGAAGTPGYVALSSVWFALSATAFTQRGARARAAALTGAIAFVCIGATGWLQFPASDHKGVPELVAREGGRLAYQRWTPIERVDVLRFDPPRVRGGLLMLGVGRTQRRDLPGHYIIARDGDPTSAIYEWDGKQDSLSFYRHHLLHAPYLLLDQPSALVLQGVGGIDVLVAVAGDAPSIRVAMENSAMREIGQVAFRDFNGGLLTREEVELSPIAPRALLREKEHYDLIALHWTRTQVPLGLGMLDLSENQLHTREAVSEYLGRLSEGGVISISLLDQGRARTPGRHLRLLRTIHRALRDGGAKDPGAHVAAIAAGGDRRLLQLLVQKEPLSDATVHALQRFAEEEGFTLGVGGRVPHVLLTDLSTQDLLVGAKRPVATDDAPFFFDTATAGDFFSFENYRALLQVRLPALSPPPLIVSVWVGLLNVLLVALWVFLRLLIDRKVPDIMRPLGSLRGSSWLLFFAAQGFALSLLMLGVIQRLATAEPHVTAGMTKLLPALMVGCALGALLHVRRHSFLEAWIRLVLLLVAWVLLRSEGPRWFEQFGLGDGAIAVPLVAGFLVGGYVTFGVEHLFRDIRWAPPAIAAALWGLGFGHSVGVLLAASSGFSALPPLSLLGIFLSIVAVYGSHGFVRLRRRRAGDSIRPPSL